MNTEVLATTQQIEKLIFDHIKECDYIFNSTVSTERQTEALNAKSHALNALVRLKNGG